MKKDRYTEETKKIRANRIQFIQQYRQTVNENLQVFASLNKIIRNVPAPNLDHFNLLNGYDINIVDTFQLNSQSTIVFHAQYYDEVKTGRGTYSGNDIYAFGYVETKSVYPNTLIQPETLEHKIKELIDPIETDFPHHKKFSQQFFVLTSQPKQLYAMLPTAAMNYLCEFNSIHLELSGSTCLFRINYKPLSSAILQQTIDTALRLQQLL